MTFDTYKQNITTITKLVIYQSSIRKKHFFKLAQDKLIYTYTVHLVLLFYFDLKHLFLILLTLNLQRHPFKKSSLIIALQIIFFQIANTFLITKNIAIDFKLVLEMYLQPISIEILFCT